MKKSMLPRDKLGNIKPIKSVKPIIDVKVASDTKDDTNRTGGPAPPADTGYDLDATEVDATVMFTI